MKLKEHENPSTTSTPSKQQHPLSWYGKWVSSVVLIIAMIFAVWSDPDGAKAMTSKTAHLFLAPVLLAQIFMDLAQWVGDGNSHGLHVASLASGVLGSGAVFAWIKMK